MKKLTTYILIASSFLLLFSACKNEKKTEEKPTEEIIISGPLSNEENKHYKEIGAEIVKATFDGLSGNLKEALQKGGVKQAVEYCNIVALSLTDSLAKKHDAKIKRTSSKLRNPKNEPSPDEIDIFTKYQKSLDSKLDINPLVIHWDDGYVKYFHPIYINELCLKCHGTPGKEINDENLSLISSLYPEDQATGYEENELRGLWSVVMKRNWQGD